MNWRPIDFRGIIDLDRKIVDQLDQYLQEKETRLALQILNSIPSSPDEEGLPSIILATPFLKLSDAVEGFSKQVRKALKGEINPALVGSGDQVTKELNAAFWEFTEVLKGSVVELFQQVRQVSIDRWHVSIAHVVHAIKEILLHRIEDLLWAIRRLENPLKMYCQIYGSKNQGWASWSLFWTRKLDSMLLGNLRQSEGYLLKNYESFNKRYRLYTRLNAQVEEELQKMKNYPILALLEVHDQNLYIDVFRLLKLLELNGQWKNMLREETVHSIKQLASIDHVLKVFRAYYREIKEAFFKSSLEWKSLDQEGEYFKESLEKLQTKIQDYQSELQHFMQIVRHYRSFLLKTDTNPYGRSRWGFSEWIVGPEPVKAKKLSSLLYATEEINVNFKHFARAITEDPLIKIHREHAAETEIEKLLHEMGQPLISRSMMHQRAERLLQQLKNFNEIGNPRLTAIDYVEETLNKAMREDWKYHELHTFPLFHEIFRLHQGMAEAFEDPSHAFRLERFRLLFDQTEEWVNKGDIYAHVHEIELDMSDMKTYLQDFLAAVQRATKEKSNDPFLDESIHRFRQQLLEYRYIFGQFFSRLMVKDKEGQQLRFQFLFVDQYFESIENLLNEMKMSWEGNVKRN